MVFTTRTNLIARLSGHVIGTALSAFALALVLVMFLGPVNPAFAGDKTYRVQEATLGQQDRTLSPDPSRFEGYDNSDFLRDMDAIARGTYISPYRGSSTEYSRQESTEDSTDDEDE